MLSPENLLKALHQREEDSQRIDKILLNLMEGGDSELRLNKYSMTYSRVYKIFEVYAEDCDEQVFKDGREAIDFIMSQSNKEELDSNNSEEGDS
jgi:hypothetical protein